ncbi:MAG: MFS transporter [Lachnospiraceae bacterium]|nr:MFS transporter [Lachnospiraceae bacterium]
MKTGYKMTIKAAYLGYVVQAIVNNFVPLLFVQMQSEFGIPLGKITLLITFNFGIQLLIDMFSAPFIDRIGYRASMIISNASVIAGLLLLTVLPGIFVDPFFGILVPVCIYAIGGGLQEVLVSPIVEACPTDNKEAQMSLLHSAYCWGHMAVVLFSTLFFHFSGISNWRYMAVLWCIIPAVDLILFTRVPIAVLQPDTEEGAGLGALMTQGVFWLMFIMMICAGASEQAVSQWSSAFAEIGLGVSKTLGDLLGPMFFALCMAVSRTIYGLKGDRIDLDFFMKLSTWLCVLSYLVIVLVQIPVIALLGCGLAGFSVGIFWPGTFSTASARIKGRGTLTFALLALAGDLGCSGGPTLAGAIAGASDDNMRVGIGIAMIFPVIMALCLGVNAYKRDTGTIHGDA